MDRILISFEKKFMDKELWDNKIVWRDIKIKELKSNPLNIWENNYKNIIEKNLIENYLIGIIWIIC
jgi:hypothetical protein